MRPGSELETEQKSSHVRVGSLSDFGARRCKVRFTSMSRHQAALLLEALLRQLPRREHKDIASLLQWLPRLFQSEMATLTTKRKRTARVDFMLGGIVPDRTNVMERAKGVELMRGIASGSGSIKRNFVPDILMRVMMTSPDQKNIVIGNGPAGVLCTMRYPTFEPRLIKPLEFVAIGSGQRSTVEIERYADWLLAGVPGSDLV